MEDAKNPLKGEPQQKKPLQTKNVNSPESASPKSSPNLANSETAPRKNATGVPSASKVKSPQEPTPIAAKSSTSPTKAGAVQTDSAKQPGEPESSKENSTPSQANLAHKAPAVSKKGSAQKAPSLKAAPKAVSKPVAAKIKASTPDAEPKDAKNAEPKDAKKKVKNKGRIYRSIRERSRMPMVVSLATIAIVMGVWLWQRWQKPTQLTAELKLFDIPAEAEIETFRTANNPYLARVFELGPNVVPLLVQKYPQMSLKEKVATVIILGEIHDAKAVDTLLNAAINDNKILAKFGYVALGKQGDLITLPLLAKLSQATQNQKDNLLEGLARTASPIALAELTKLTKSPDPQTAQIALGKLFYFGEDRKVLEMLLDALVSPNQELGQAALEVFQRLYKSSKLAKHTEFLTQQLKKAVTQHKDPPVRSRLIRAIAMVGSLQSFQKADYGDLVKELKDLFRKALVSEHPEEIAAGAYGSGLLEDTDSLERLLTILDHDVADVSLSAATALNNLNDPDAALKLLATQLSSSNRQHVLSATAIMLNHYQLHLVKLGIKDKAIKFLTESHKNANGETLKQIQKLLEDYQK